MKWIHPIVSIVLVFALTACEGRSQKPLPFGLHQRAKVIASDDAKDITSSSPLPHTREVVLGIRGGAIDRKLVAATASASILTLYAASCALAPDEVLKGYGVPITPATTFMARTPSVLTSTATFVAWCLLYSKMSVHRAVGISAIPYVLRSLHNLLARTPTKFGYSAVTEYASLALSSLVSYATLTNAPYADTAFKGFSLAMLLHGFFVFCFPNRNGGMPVFLFRNHGNNLMINGVFYTALAMGYDVFQAFALCWYVAGTGMGAMAYVTKDIPNFAPDAVGPVNAWVVICYTGATLMIL